MLIIEKMEKMVDPDQPEGEWITKYDLVEKVRWRMHEPTQQPAEFHLWPPACA